MCLYVRFDDPYIFKALLIHTSYMHVCIQLKANAGRCHLPYCATARFLFDADRKAWKLVKIY